MKPQLFLIWSWEHKAWWCPASNGYTEVKENAGLYSYEEALEIVLGANFSFNKYSAKMPNEAMVPFEMKP